MAMAANWRRESITVFEKRVHDHSPIKKIPV